MTGFELPVLVVTVLTALYCYRLVVRCATDTVKLVKECIKTYLLIKQIGKESKPNKKKRK